MLLDSSSLSSILLHVQSESVKIKALGLKELQEYLTSTRSISWDNLSYVIESLLRCMEKEGRRRLSTTKGSGGSTSVALATVFENVIKTICFCIRRQVKRDDQNLVTNSKSFSTAINIKCTELTLFIIQGITKHNSVRNHSDYLSFYYKSLTVICRTPTIITALPFNVIRDALSVLLRFNSNAKTNVTSLSTAERLRAVSELCQHSTIIHSSYDITRTLIIRISDATDQYAQNANIISSAIHCIYSLTFRTPLSIARILMEHPSVWVTLKQLLNLWITFDAVTQISLVQIFRMIFRLLKTPQIGGKRHLSFTLTLTLCQSVLLGLEKILLGYLQSLLKSDSHQKEDIIVQSRWLPSLFVLSTHPPSSRRLILAQIIDLLAIVILEIAIHSKTQFKMSLNIHDNIMISDDGNFYCQATTDIELSLTYLFQSSDEFSVARMAVAARILERLKGCEPSPIILEVLGQRWCDRLQDLLSCGHLQFQENFSSPNVSGMMVSSKVLVGTLEHHHQKGNLELYWTATALNGLMDFWMYQRDPLCEVQFHASINYDHLFGSSLVSSSRVWLSSKQFKPQLSLATLKSLQLLLTTLFGTFIQTELSNFRKITGYATTTRPSSIQLCSSDYCYQNACLLMNLLFCLPTNIIKETIDKSLEEFLLNISATTPVIHSVEIESSFKRSIQTHTLFFTKGHNLLLWTSIIISLPESSTGRLRLSTMIGKAFLNASVEDWASSAFGAQFIWYFQTTYPSRFVSDPWFFTPSFNLNVFSVNESDTWNSINYGLMLSNWSKEVMKASESENQLAYFSSLLNPQRSDATLATSIVNEIRRHVRQSKENPLPAVVKRSIFQLFWDALQNALGVEELQNLGKLDDEATNWHNVLASLEISRAALVLLPKEDIIHKRGYQINTQTGYQTEAKPVVDFLEKLILIVHKLISVPDRPEKAKYLCNRCGDNLNSAVLRNSFSRFLQSIITLRHEKDFLLLAKICFHAIPMCDEMTSLTIKTLTPKNHISTYSSRVISRPTSPGKMTHDISTSVTNEAVTVDRKGLSDSKHCVITTGKIDLQRMPRKRRRTSESSASTSSSRNIQLHRITQQQAIQSPQNLWVFGSNDENLEPLEVRPDETDAALESLWELPDRREYDRRLHHSHTQCEDNSRDINRSSLSIDGEELQLGEAISISNNSNNVDGNVSYDVEQHDEPFLMEHIQALICLDVLQNCYDGRSCIAQLITEAIGTGYPAVVQFIILGILGATRLVLFESFFNSSSPSYISCSCFINCHVKDALCILLSLPETAFHQNWTSIDVIIREWILNIGILVEIVLSSNSVANIEFIFRVFLSQLTVSGANEKNLINLIKSRMKNLENSSYKVQIQFRLLQLGCFIASWKNRIKLWIDSQKKDCTVLTVLDEEVLEISEDEVNLLEYVIKQYLVPLQKVENFDKRDDKLIKNYTVITLFNHFELPLLLGPDCLTIAFQAFNQNDLIEDFEQFTYLFNDIIENVMKFTQFVQFDQDLSPNVKEDDSVSGNRFLLNSVLRRGQTTQCKIQLQDEEAIRTLLPFNTEASASANNSWLLQTMWLPNIIIIVFQCHVTLSRCIKGFRSEVFRELLSLYARLSNEQAREKKNQSPESSIHSISKHQTTVFPFGTTQLHQHDQFMVELGFNHYELWKQLIVYFLNLLVVSALDYDTTAWQRYCLQCLKQCDNNSVESYLVKLKINPKMPILDLLELWYPSVFITSQHAIQGQNQWVEKPFFNILTTFWQQHYDLFASISVMTSACDNITEVVQRLATLLGRETDEALTPSLVQSIAVGLVLKRITVSTSSSSLVSPQAEMLNSCVQLKDDEPDQKPQQLITLVNQPDNIRQFMHEPQRILLCVFRLYLFDLLPHESLSLEGLLDEVIIEIYGRQCPTQINIDSDETATNVKIVNWTNRERNVDLSITKRLAYVNLILKDLLTPSRLGDLLSQVDLFTSSVCINRKSPQDRFLCWLLNRLFPDPIDPNISLKEAVKDIPTNQKRIETADASVRDIILIQILFRYSIQTLTQRFTQSQSFVDLEFQHSVQAFINKILALIVKFLLNPSKETPCLSVSPYWTLGEALGRLVSSSTRFVTSPTVYHMNIDEQLYNILTSVPSTDLEPLHTITNGGDNKTINTSFSSNCDVIISMVGELIKLQLQQNTSNKRQAGGRSFTTIYRAIARGLIKLFVPLYTLCKESPLMVEMTKRVLTQFRKVIHEILPELLPLPFLSDDELKLMIRGIIQPREETINDMLGLHYNQRLFVFLLLLLNQSSCLTSPHCLELLRRILQFSFSLIGTPTFKTKDTIAWIWDEEQVVAVYQFLGRLDLQSLAQSVISWRLGEIGPSQLESLSWQNCSLQLLECALVKSFKPNRCQRSQDHSYLLEYKTNLEIQHMTLKNSGMALEASLFIISNLFRVFCLSYIEESRGRVFRNLCYPFPPRLSSLATEIIQHLYHEWTLVLFPNHSFCDTKFEEQKKFDKFSEITESEENRHLATYMGSRELGRLCTNIWTENETQTQKQAPDNCVSNASSFLTPNGSIGLSHLIILLARLGSFELQDDFDDMLKLNSTFCAYSLLPLLLFKAIVSYVDNKSNIGDLLSMVTKTFISSSDKKPRIYTMRALIASVMGLRELLIKGNAAPLISHKRTKHKNNEHNVTCSQPKETLLLDAWNNFWNNLDLVVLSEAALHCGLPAESQLLINIHCTGTREEILSTCSTPSSKKPTRTPVALSSLSPSGITSPQFRAIPELFPSLLKSNVPAAASLLVLSLYQLSIGLPDAFHGSLSPWISPDVLIQESIIGGQHWRRLAFLHSTLARTDVSSQFLSSMVKESKLDIAWCQKVGIPFKSSVSNRSSMFEGMWRLGEWDSAEKLFYRTKNMSFQQTVFECCDQLRRSLQDSHERHHVFSDGNSVAKTNTFGTHIVDDLACNFSEEIFQHLHNIHDQFYCVNPENVVSRIIQQSMVTSIEQWSQCMFYPDKQQETISTWIKQYRGLCEYPSVLRLFEMVISLRRSLIRLVSLEKVFSRSIDHNFIREPSFPTSIENTLHHSVVGHTSCAPVTTDPSFSKLTSVISSNTLQTLEFEMLDCQALRLEGLPDAALIRSLTILNEVELLPSNLVKSYGGQELSVLAQWQCSRGFWEAGDQRRALVLGTKLVDQQCKSEEKVCESTKALELRSQIMATVGQWAFENQTESLDKIEDLYLKPAAELCKTIVTKERCISEQQVENPNQGRLHLLGEYRESLDALRIYGSILDEILQMKLEQNYSRDAVEAKGIKAKHQNELKSIEQGIQDLSRRKDVTSENERQRLQHDKRQLINELQAFDLVDEREHDVTRALALRSMENYCNWLTGCQMPQCHLALKAVARVLSLWFDFGIQFQQLNSMILKSIGPMDKVNVRLLFHFRPFVYQIASRLDLNNDSSVASNSTQRNGPVGFQEVLRHTLISLIMVFPFHCIYPLLLLRNGDRIPHDTRGQDRFITHRGRIDGARHVLQSASDSACDPTGALQSIIVACDAVSNFFIDLGNLKLNKNQAVNMRQTPAYQQLIKAAKILPVITSTPTEIPAFDVKKFKFTSESGRGVSAKAGASDMLTAIGYFVQTQLGVPTMESFSNQVRMTDTGITGPKIVRLTDTMGVEHKLIVKGGDDLRQDAVIEQLFFLLNKVLGSIPLTRDRGLSVRTYHVVPLSPTVGMVQWVTGTATLSEFAIGKTKETKFKHRQRYYSQDLSNDQAREILMNARDLNKPQLQGNTSRQINERLLYAFRYICDRFHPIMDLRLVESFPSPQSWVIAMQRFNRSLAINSMIGYLMGIGDRHTNNILIDLNTGEFVHIDFGVVFEKGKTLPIPEIVPFRLTREIVNGLGPLRFEGPFRMNCEVTLEVLRSITPLVTSVVEVFVFDPLYLWSLSPRKIMQHTKNKFGKQMTLNEVQVGHSGNKKARAVLLQVRRKLLGVAPLDDAPSELTILRGEGFRIPSLVDRLIRQAISEERLCMMFAGWNSWV